MDYKLAITLNYVSTFLVLLPLIIGLTHFKLMTKKERVFFWFIVYSFLSTYFAFYTFLSGTSNNLYLIHIYTLAQLFLLTWFLYLNNANQKYRKLILIVVSIICVSAIFEAFSLQLGIKQYNSLTRSLTAIWITYLSVKGLIELRKNELIVNLAHEPLFWFIIGVTISYSANIVIYVFQKSVQNLSNEALLQMAIIEAIMNITSLLLYSIGFWKIKKRAIFSSPI
jgi:hypothetical protein